MRILESGLDSASFTRSVVFPEPAAATIILSFFASGISFFDRGGHVRRELNVLLRVENLKGAVRLVRSHMLQELLFLVERCSEHFLHRGASVRGEHPRFESVEVEVLASDLFARVDGFVEADADIAFRFRAEIALVLLLESVDVSVVVCNDGDGFLQLLCNLQETQEARADGNDIHSTLDRQLSVFELVRFLDYEFVGVAFDEYRPFAEQKAKRVVPGELLKERRRLGIEVA